MARLIAEILKWSFKELCASEASPEWYKKH